MTGYLFTLDGNLYWVDTSRVDDNGIACKRHQEQDVGTNYCGKIVDGGYFPWTNIDSFEKVEQDHFAEEYSEFAMFEEGPDGEEGG